MKTLVVSTVVAVLALSGGAFAAGKSTGRNIKDGTVTGRDIKNHSLTARDFKGRLPRGRRGPTGPQGPAGPRGAAGPQGPAGIAAIIRVNGPAVTQGAFGSGGSEVQAATATCPPGGYVVGGGFIADGLDDRVMVAEAPNPTQYSVLAINYDSQPTTLRAHVICAGGAGVHAVALRQRGTPRAITRRVVRLRAELNASR